MASLFPISPPAIEDSALPERPVHRFVVEKHLSKRMGIRPGITSAFAFSSYRRERPIRCCLSGLSADDQACRRDSAGERTCHEDAHTRLAGRPHCHPRAHRISDRRHQGQAKFPSRANLPLRFRRGVAQLPLLQWDLPGPSGQRMAAPRYVVIPRSGIKLPH
jgi:hypothetical protein